MMMSYIKKTDIHDGAKQCLHIKPNYTFAKYVELKL